MVKVPRLLKHWNLPPDTLVRCGTWSDLTHHLLFRSALQLILRALVRLSKRSNFFLQILLASAAKPFSATSTKVSAIDSPWGHCQGSGTCFCNKTLFNLQQNEESQIMTKVSSWSIVVRAVACGAKGSRTNLSSLLRNKEARKTENLPI